MMSRFPPAWTSSSQLQPSGRSPVTSSLRDRLSYCRAMSVPSFLICQSLNMSINRPPQFWFRAAGMSGSRVSRRSMIPSYPRAPPFSGKGSSPPAPSSGNRTWHPANSHP